MWLLRDDSKGLIYRVTPGKQHVVSRKDGDLLLVDDQSISRKHAQLFVCDDGEGGGIAVKDLKSKYGTFFQIGDTELAQLPSNEEITLKCGDCVKFGIQWNTWRAEFVPLVVATSTLTSEEKEDVKRIILNLGGQVVSDWQKQCTHLTMNQITVTVKVVCALASGQPIVTPAYWTQFAQALNTMQTTLPDTKDFSPPLAEAVLNPSEVSFTPNPARSKLFSGFTFVAATAKQLSRIKSMITAAGGSVVPFSAKSWSHNKLLEEKTILMQHSANDKQGSQNSQIPSGYVAVARKLKAAGVRCIPESEIGLSVLYCSTAQYCNPHFSMQSLLAGNSQHATQPITVICPDSEASTSSSNSNTSFDKNLNQVNMKKREHELGDDEEPQTCKKTNAAQDSEDLFGSEAVHLQNTQANPNLHRTSKNSTLKSCTSPKDTGNVKAIANPSLDIFAPTYDQSSKPSCSSSRASGIVPSCQDMFASSSSKSVLNKKENSDDFFFVTNKSGNTAEKGPILEGGSSTDHRTVGEAIPSTSKATFNKLPDNKGDVDEFSFTTSKRSTIKKSNVDENDEFSFQSVKKRRKTENRDEFSFVSNQISKKKESNDEPDEFSFQSVKKRNRQSNPDMFASTSESTSNTVSINHPLKIRKIQDDEEFNFREPKCLKKNEDLFAFPNNKPKRNLNNNNSILSADETDSEMKVPMFLNAKKEVTGLDVKQTVIACSEEVIPPEDKNLTVYSKLLPASVKVKEEVEDEEMDELAKELYNTTIVLVQPLIAVKPKSAEEPVASTGKNFKKFHKVFGLNKRVVPHIIGGSDLVAHTKGGSMLDDDMENLPAAPSPRANTPHEFAFPKKKNIGDHWKCIKCQI